MADPTQMLQTLLNANRAVPQSGPADPRMEAIKQMMLQAGSRLPQADAYAGADPEAGGKTDSNSYTGQRGSPDLPSQRDNRMMQNSGDMGLQDYVDQFGWERMQNPNGPPAGYVPTPRPRQPDLNTNTGGYGDAEPQPVPPGVDLKPSDLARRGVTTEQELQMVHDGIGKGDYTDGYVELTGNVEKDAQLISDSPTPENIKNFVDKHGEENLPDDVRADYEADNGPPGNR